MNFLQPTPQVKAQLPSSATACYALAVSADGKVRNKTCRPLFGFNSRWLVLVHAGLFQLLQRWHYCCVGPPQQGLSAAVSRAH